MANEIPESVVVAMQEQSFMREQLSVTEVDYRDAVSLLVKAAQSDTSCSMVAAQVLLSLYNGYEFHIDLAALGALDYQLLHAALIAIRGRTILLNEPHDVIENGKKIFAVLSDEWAHLHVKHRYQKHYI